MMMMMMMMITMYYKNIIHNMLSVMKINQYQFAYYII